MMFMLSPSQTVGHDPSTPVRVREILAVFDKRKHKVKEALGVRRERYVEVRSQPVMKSDVRDYAGTYEETTLGDVIEIRVGGDGAVEVAGSEAAAGAKAARRFTLEGIRIDRALLSATKVYEDGAAEAFEGLFIDLERAEGVSPQQIEHRSTAFGFGVVERRQVGGVNLDRLFYERKR